MAKEKQLPTPDEQPRGERAFRSLAKAVGEVIEANLHEGGQRTSRLASAELHLKAAFDELEPEHEPGEELELETTGDGEPDKKPSGDVETED